MSWTTKKKASATALAIGGAAFVYASFVEPYQIRTVEIVLKCARLPEKFNGYKVLQISDLHMRKLGRRERSLQKLLESLPQHDLALITGDLIHTPQGARPFIELSKSIAARDGVFAVFGNSEHKNGVNSSRFACELAEAGIDVLTNRNVEIKHDGESIFLLGVDDPVSQYDDLPKAIAGIPENAFKLLMMHSPDPIGLAAAYGIDVVLSGHTHGGQIRLPLLGPLFTNSILGLTMSEGLYQGADLLKIIGFRAGRTQLYVTRGVGVSNLALRFLCQPEINSITLRRS